MRTVYTNDQIKGFIDKKDWVWIIGDLILKGKPYTNPKHAVDKDYVDNAFKNVTENNLKYKLPAEKYPAFNGDLINKAGTNNFQLKTVVKAANKVHRFTVDNKGRVTGYKTGKFIFDAKDFDKIDFDKIDYPSTGSILDYLPNFNFNDYLTVARENVISKPLDFRTKYPRGKHDVLSLKETMTASEKYFTGQLNNIKRDGINTVDLETDNVHGYDNIGALPWLRQIGITPYTSDIISPNPINSISLESKWVSGIGETTIMESTILSFIRKDYLHLINVDPKNNPDRISYKLPLDSNGRISKDTPFILNKTPDFSHLNIDHGTQVYQGLVYLCKESVVIRLYGQLGGYAYHVHIFMDEEENIIEDKNDVHPKHGIGDLTLIGNKGYHFPIWSRATMIYNIDRDTFRVSSSEAMPAMIHSRPVNGFIATKQDFTIGPYIYNVYTSANSNFYSGSVAGRKNDKVIRTITIDGKPYGNSVIKTFPNIVTHTSMYIPPVTVTGGVIFFSAMSNSNGKINITLNQCKYKQNGDLVFDRDVRLNYDFIYDSTNFRVVLSSGAMFIISRYEIVSFPYKGTTNDYTKYVTNDYWKSLPGHQ